MSESGENGQTRGFIIVGLCIFNLTKIIYNRVFYEQAKEQISLIIECNQYAVIDLNKINQFKRNP